jgi:hypothetical protein
MLYVRYVRLTKAKHIHKRQAHLLVWEEVFIGTMTARVQLQKEREKSGRAPQGAWRQDELMGGKPPVVK